MMKSINVSSLSVKYCHNEHLKKKKKRTTILFYLINGFVKSFKL